MKMTLALLAACAVLTQPVVESLTAQQPQPPSADEAARIRTTIQTIENMLPQVRDRGAALYLLARRYAQLGEDEKALQLLEQCIPLDEGFDPSAASVFARLSSNSRFKALAERARRRFPAVQRGHVALEIPANDLFSEGLAVDSERRLFYMGSVLQRKIIQFAENGSLRDFFSSTTDALLPPNGLRVDTKDHSLWIASASDHESASELVHLSATGKLLERFRAPDPGPHDFNDLVVRHQLDIYVTDTAANQLYRLDYSTRTITPVPLSRPLVYPNGIALTPDERALYIADAIGLIRMDLTNGHSRELDPPAHDTLAGVDGLYWYRGTLLGISYGTSTYRVMRWHLRPDGRKVVSSEVLERGTPLLKFPTTGAVLGKKFYFISNADFDNYHDGKVVHPERLEPTRIGVIALN